MSLVEALLVLAIVVIVPAAVPLHPAGRRWHTPVAVVAGLPTVAAVTLPQGTLAAALTVPWLAITLAASASLGWRWLAADRTAQGLLWAVTVGYLAVGAAWLSAHTLGLTPAGFGPPFVALTAIHFHYAGAISTVLVACAWRLRRDRPTAVAAVATASAPPLVAIGFVAVGALQVVGAVQLTVGLFLLAGVTLHHVAPTQPPTTRWLLVGSSLAVLLPMLLAVQWAVGANLGTPALSIPTMALTHGVANALGFALLGVLGWRGVIATGAAGPTADSGRRRAGPLDGVPTTS